MKRMMVVVLLPVTLGLTSCVAGPRYRARTAEQMNIPAAWHAALPEKVESGDLSAWWRQLGDPLLSQLVEEALQASPSIDLARAKLREARAQRNLAVADLLPSINASGNATRTKNDGPAATNYRAGLDASWEPDIFGGKRRSLQAAAAELQSTAESLHDTQVSLSAEVALNYVDVRSLQARVAIAEENLALQTETRQIAEWRYQAGLVGCLDADQARSTEAQTRAQIPALQTSLAEARNRIAVLLGAAPGALDERFAVVAPIPAVPQHVTIGIPADILRQRPDVRAAERTLAAQTAHTGAAIAAQFPSLSLSGSLGVEGITLSALTGGATAIRTLVASIAQTIFDGGRIRRQIQVKRAVQEQALATYENKVLTALEEVENALVAIVRNRERYTYLQTADAAARNAAQFARQSYASGISDYVSVLETQRTQLSVSDSLKSCEADITTALIQLYKALGGGWTAAESTIPAMTAQGKNS
jgi:multidrug efflux system outer membrane protein